MPQLHRLISLFVHLRSFEQFGRLLGKLPPLRPQRENPSCFIYTKQFKTNNLSYAENPAALSQSDYQTKRPMIRTVTP